MALKPRVTKQALTLALVAGFMMASTLTFASTKKPKPPKELEKIMNELIAFEDNFRNIHWKKAGHDVEAIAKDFSHVKVEIAHHVSAKVLAAFENDIHHFEKDIKSHDVKDIEHSLVEIQHLLLDVMDHYDYQYAPIYMFMFKYLEEMVEELSHDKFGIIIAEMKEFPAYEKVLSSSLRRAT